MSDKQLTIPWEVADKITVEILKDTYKTVKEELVAHDNEMKTLSDEDVGYNYNLLRSLKVVLKYFGEEP